MGFRTIIAVVGAVVCEERGFGEQMHLFFDGLCSPMVSAKWHIESQSHSNLLSFYTSFITDTTI